MLFGSLFSSYVLLRTGAETWPVQSSILNVPLAALNTVILISSSVTMVLSWAALMMTDFSNYNLYMGLTFLAGLGVLLVRAFDDRANVAHGPPRLPATGRL